MARRSWWLVTVPALAAFAFGTAAAQTGGDVKAGSAVTPADQVSSADASVTKIQTAATRVRHLLDDARKNSPKDIVKLTCLQDKLAQIEISLDSAKKRSSSLKNAQASGNKDLANHEFTMLTTLRQRSEQLDAEANQCIGEEIGFPGDTKIKATIDPNIAPVDPGGSTGWTDPGVIIVVPPASPVK